MIKFNSHIYLLAKNSKRRRGKKAYPWKTLLLINIYFTMFLFLVSILKSLWIRLAFLTPYIKFYRVTTCRHPRRSRLRYKRLSTTWRHCPHSLKTTACSLSPDLRLSSLSGFKWLYLLTPVVVVMSCVIEWPWRNGTDSEAIFRSLRRDSTRAASKIYKNIVSSRVIG